MLNPLINLIPRPFFLVISSLLIFFTLTYYDLHMSFSLLYYSSSFLSIELFWFTLIYGTFLSLILFMVFFGVYFPCLVSFLSIKIHCVAVFLLSTLRHSSLVLFTPRAHVPFYCPSLLISIFL